MPLNLSKGLTHIREQVSPNSLTVECGGEKCKVYLTDDIPRKRVVINVEKEFDARGESRKRCDRLLFYGNKNTLVAVPIELKSGKGDESQVLEQLKSGLEICRYPRAGFERNCLCSNCVYQERALDQGIQDIKTENLSRAK